MDGVDDDPHDDVLHGGGLDGGGLDGRDLDRDVIVAAARQWIADDPDPASRAELAALVQAAAGTGAGAGNLAELADRMSGRLRFGTAGLRGPLRAGPSGMNPAVVRRAAAGLAAYLNAHVSARATVVVGYDARHGSERFALDSAAVFTAAGLRAMVLPGPLPTPVLAFAVRHLGADAGVMVTASHNPATDNGFKVYLGGADPQTAGAQIVPPADEEIEAAIDASGPANAIGLADGWTRLPEDVVTAYIAAAAATVTGAGDVTIAYTPLHGVGAGTLLAAFAAAGFSAPHVVASQREPDPDFPGLPFPNPEEPGVLDEVLALGAATGADVVIANDPDADRCAVAVGGRVLTGDELGVLLGDHLLSTRTGLVATTIVSSTWLVRVAAAHGAPCARTLTGFKWIMRAGPGMVFGYEEALGYAVAPDLVRDKDGITAALAVAELAALEKARGRTLLDRLDDLARAHGVHLTGQVSIRVDDLAVIATIMAGLRTCPPSTFGLVAVRSAVDLTAGAEGLPPSDVLLYEVDGGRVVVRPSGTEPKLKIYLEVVVPVAAGPAGLSDARRTASRHLDDLRAGVSATIC